MHTTTIERLQIANITRQKEWDTDGAIDLFYRGNELAGEVGEACNILKKLDRERLGIRGSRSTKDALAEELADVVICASLIANAVGIDLAEEYGLRSFPTFNNRDVSLSHQGNSLAIRTGLVCAHLSGKLFLSFAIAKLAVDLSNLCKFVSVIGSAEDIDMDLAVAAKFNATTRKVGLTTFM